MQRRCATTILVVLGSSLKYILMQRYDFFIFVACYCFVSDTNTVKISKNTNTRFWFLFDWFIFFCAYHRSCLDCWTARVTHFSAQVPRV